MIDSFPIIFCGEGEKHKTFEILRLRKQNM